MGILDRIAGTLDELTGDGRAAVADEIARARALAAEGDPGRAETLLTELTRRAPDVAEAFLALGELQAGRGALEEAVAPLGRAVDLNGGYAAAWCALGEALAGLGRIRSRARCAPQDSDAGLRQHRPEAARHRGARPGACEGGKADPRRTRAAEGDRDGRPRQRRRRRLPAGAGLRPRPGAAR